MVFSLDSKNEASFSIQMYMYIVCIQCFLLLAPKLHKRTWHHISSLDLNQPMKLQYFEVYHVHTYLHVCTRVRCGRMCIYSIVQCIVASCAYR